MLRSDEHELLYLLKCSGRDSVGDLVEKLYSRQAWSADAAVRKSAMERTRRRLYALSKKGMSRSVQTRTAYGVFREWMITPLGIRTLQEYTKLHIYLTMNSLAVSAHRVGLKFKDILQTMLTDPDID